MISKLIDNITYPLFALKEAPFQVKFGDTDIKITKQHGGKEYIFDIMVEEADSYTERLFKIEDQMEDRIQFDYTVLNREQLVFNYETIEWGVDSLGKIYNLQHKQNIPIECRKVTKVKNNKLWVEKQLAPFELKIPLEESNVDELWVNIVRINNEWFLKSFCYEYQDNNNFCMI